MTVRWLFVLLVTACHGRPAPLQSRAPIQTPAPRVVPREVVPVEDPPSMFDPPRRVVTSTSITILDQIAFVGDTAKIQPRSVPMIDAIASSFSANPDLCVVEVGATPDTELGEQRATAVVDALVARGIDRGRLRAARIAPVKDNDPLTQFLILERADASGSCSRGADGTS